MKQMILMIYMKKIQKDGILNQKCNVWDVKQEQVIIMLIVEKKEEYSVKYI